MIFIKKKSKFVNQHLFLRINVKNGFFHDKSIFFILIKKILTLSAIFRLINQKLADLYPRIANLIKDLNFNSHCPPILSYKLESDINRMMLMKLLQIRQPDLICKP